MMHLMDQKGYTLIELLITVAIIGLLSAAGVIGYQSYTAEAERVDAQNALRSIYLMQLDYRADSGYYWPSPGGSACAQSDCSTTINSELFSGTITIRPDSPFDFTVTSTPSGSTAPTGYSACAANSTSNTFYQIDQNNSLTTPASCP